MVFNYINKSQAIYLFSYKGQKICFYCLTLPRKLPQTCLCATSRDFLEQKSRRIAKFLEVCSLLLLFSEIDISKFCKVPSKNFAKVLTKIIIPFNCIINKSFCFLISCQQLMFLIYCDMMGTERCSLFVGWHFPTFSWDLGVFSFFYWIIIYLFIHSFIVALFHLFVSSSKNCLFFSFSIWDIFFVQLFCRDYLYPRYNTLFTKNSSGLPLYSVFGMFCHTESFILFFTSFVEVKFTNKNDIYLWGITWYFDICIPCEMINSS